ncbi:Protein of unknown function [Chryseobacterium ureilyticum]|uniref:Uncharacterized protein n=1 Tax=Chryseobacterium ureilyticum TaxID=373668 RepID=A0A1N7PEH8_9FLAO|nr:DUF3892 domain-containing protein [Chryseobacterium ureilyticum]SIT08930.1 Protein of unknown function [Chryseobacterium ureilyticum]
MRNYVISGVWRDFTGTITDYAVHAVTNINPPHFSFDQATKYSKADAIALFDNPRISVWTVIWNYTTKAWHSESEVSVIGHGIDRYLRSSPNGIIQDNLEHLIDYGSITNGFY